MSEFTPNLGLPLIAASQAQKHVPVNEALLRLDALMKISVLNRHSTEPPQAPENGERYIVGSGAGGVWAGHDNKIAAYDAGWIFTGPGEGWLAWDSSGQELVVFTDGEWIAVTSGLITGDLQDLPLLGVGTQADEMNPFSAKLNTALWTAKETGEDGTGDLRYIMNKESSANVLSLLMQSAYGGRAEIGLIGDEDLLIKVSTDGDVWTEAIRVDHASGRVSFPKGGVREQLAGARTYYIRPDGDDDNDGLTDAVEGAFRTIQRAVDVAASLDLSVFDVTLSIGDGTYPEAVVLKTLVGAGSVRIIGNAGAPENVLISASSGRGCFSGAFRGNYFLQGLKLVSTTANGIEAVSGGAIVEFSDIDFGACADSHIKAQAGALIDAVGNYSITGGAQRHLVGYQGGIARNNGRTILLAGTPAFSARFAHAFSMGIVLSSGASYSGAATGVRYDVMENSLIRTGGRGPDYFPGDAAGSDATGGVYV